MMHNKSKRYRVAKELAKTIRNPQKMDQLILSMAIQYNIFLDMDSIRR
jgi:hypothetical protein